MLYHTTRRHIPDDKNVLAPVYKYVDIYGPHNGFSQNLALEFAKICR
jgi:hypothetical protein